MFETLYLISVLVTVVFVACVVLAVPQWYRRRRFQALAMAYGLTYTKTDTSRGHRLRRFLLGDGGHHKENILKGVVNKHTVEVHDLVLRGFVGNIPNPYRITICKVDGTTVSLPQKFFFSRAVSCNQIKKQLHALAHS